MSRFSKNMEVTAPENAEDFISEFEGKTSSDSLASLTKDELEQTFRYREALLLVDRVEDAANVLKGLKDKIFHFREKGGDPVSFIEFFSEWTLLAVAYTSETKQDFVCMPYYLELLDAFDEVPEAYYNDRVKAKLQLIFHYSFWKAAGGVVSNLTEEDRQMLETMQADFPAEVETQVADAEENGDFELAADLMKSLYRYYLSLKKPNEAITWLKAVIEILPQTPDFKQTELADLNLDLGKILYGYKKYTAALRYFEKAKEIYAAGGEELETQFLQAEVWVEDCRGK